MVIFYLRTYISFIHSTRNSPSSFIEVWCNRTCFHVISVLVSDNIIIILKYIIYLYIDIYIYMHKCDYTFAAPDDNKLS